MHYRLLLFLYTGMKEIIITNEQIHSTVSVCIYTPFELLFSRVLPMATHAYNIIVDLANNFQFCLNFVPNLYSALSC